MQAVSNPDFNPDLPRLFERLGIKENPDSFQATFENLQILHKSFLLTFPFENLNIHLKDIIATTDNNGCKVDIHPQRIEKKLVHDGRGGYCFEVNQYFYYTLRTLGYHVTPIMARVLWMGPPGFQAPRNHFISIVTMQPSTETPYENQYLCDVAFGTPSFVSPLSLNENMIDKPQATKYDTHRIVRYSLSHNETGISDNSSDHYLVQTLTDSGKWETMYLFHKKEIATYADWYCANWQVATMPMSIFLTTVMLSILKEDCKIALTNEILLIRKIKGNDTGSGEDDGESSSVIRKQITNREEYFSILETMLTLPVINGWKEVLHIPGLDAPNNASP
jgi:N-hydroxyarylamine O-acetyltransferase